MVIRMPSILGFSLLFSSLSSLRRSELAIQWGFDGIYIVMMRMYLLLDLLLLLLLFASGVLIDGICSVSSRSVISDIPKIVIIIQSRMPAILGHGVMTREIETRQKSEGGGGLTKANSLNNLLS
jgi:hypothetical protein